MASPPKPSNEDIVIPDEPKRLQGSSERIAIAQSQVGVKEVPLNSNRGPSVDRYNLTCGKDFIGQPWCASFARWCFYEVGIKEGIPGAWSPSWYKASKEVSKDKIQVGDQALVYFPSLKRYAHVIACVESIKMRGSKNVEVVTIEGNTSDGGSREGIGVFRRVRSVDSLTFVRWN